MMLRSRSSLPLLDKTNVNMDSDECASETAVAISSDGSTQPTPPATLTTKTSPVQAQSLSPFLLKSTVIASLGGVLFGYDMGVVSGALPQISASFSLSLNEKEMVVSFLYIGAAFGALLGGSICDTLGRKKSILLTDIIFLIGAIILFVAPNLSIILFGRVVMGFGVSLSGIADVAYLHEIAPSSYRGGLVSCNEACISLGFLLAYGSGYFWSLVMPSEGWRVMFGCSGFIAVLQFVGMWSMPESPNWLDSQGRNEEANIVRNIIGLEQESIYKHQTSFSSFKSHYKQCTVAVFLSVIQQLCGHPNVLNYAPEIFKQAGLTGKYSLASTIALGFIKFFVTLFVIFKIDNIGRRTLLRGGMTIICVSLLFLATSFHGGTINTTTAIMGAIGVVMGYAGSFGPLTWLITSEMFPTDIRGRALGLSTLITYSTASLVSYTFLSGQDAFGAAVPFLIYFGITLGALFFAVVAIPDTGGKTPAFIEKEMRRMLLWRKLDEYLSCYTVEEYCSILDSDDEMDMPTRVIC